MGYYNEEIMELANELIDKIYENGTVELIGERAGMGI